MDPDPRSEEVARVLLDGGYCGWMSREYVGAPGDSFAIVQAHQSMLKRYIASYPRTG